MGDAPIAPPRPGAASPPAPPTPRGPGPVRTAWRKLRTMRTAIILLLMLAAGAAVGSLFPQRPIDTAAVDRWVERHPEWAVVAERLGLFDVFGSWWFMLIYGLLLVSLAGCLIPRYRAFWRSVRSRPRATAALSAQPHYTSGTVAVEPDLVLRRAESVLRSKRFRMQRAGATVAAEKGHWREGGSLVFHTAFFVILIGMSIGKWFGFSGQVAVVEGERFTDTHIAYDFISEGRFFNEAHRGMSIVLDDFDVAWHPNGVPKDFVASVQLHEGDRLVRRENIRVNSPLTYEGVRLYLLSWGWAPHVRVRQGGEVLYDGPTVFLPQEGLWRGVVKVPQTKPHQTGLELLFFTDPGLGRGGMPFNRSPAPVAPLIVFRAFAGDLGLTVPQSVYALDKSRLVPSEGGALRLGAKTTLPNGIEVEFAGLRQYSVFQVASNPGAVPLLIGAVLVLVGLVPALYSSRRRVWVRAQPAGDIARLEIAGHALQRKAAFEEEFKALVRDLDKNLHAEIGAPDG